MRILYIHCIEMSRRIVFIDASYFIFHRFFATYRWYSLRSPEITAPAKDDAFIDAFRRHLENDIRKIHKEYEPAEIWIMKDCQRCDIWRMNLYPEYKATRTHAAVFDGSIFEVAYLHLDAMKESYPIRTFAQPHLEADDLCYICQRYVIDNDVVDNVVIIANDNDYLQMICDRVSVRNKEGKDIHLRDPNHKVIKKILTGDKSDNIPPVYKGMGEKTAEKMLTSMTQDELECFLRKKGDNVWNQYVLNTQLIDLRMIPSNLVDEIVENLKTI